MKLARKYLHQNRRTCYALSTLKFRILIAIYGLLRQRLIIKIVDTFKNMRVFLKCSVEYLGIFCT